MPFWCIYWELWTYFALTLNKLMLAGYLVHVFSYDWEMFSDPRSCTRLFITFSKKNPVFFVFYLMWVIYKWWLKSLLSTTRKRKYNTLFKCIASSHDIFKVILLYSYDTTLKEYSETCVTRKKNAPKRFWPRFCRLLKGVYFWQLFPWWNVRFIHVTLHKFYTPAAIYCDEKLT